MLRRTEPDCFYGGGVGIRTLGTLRYNRFRVCHLRPLGHPSRKNGLIAQAVLSIHHAAEKLNPELSLFAACDGVLQRTF